MSVGFGFSAGDFISALELVATVVDALRESGESSTEFRALVAQLTTLQTALESVNRLDIDDAQQGEAIALQQAAAQCQRTINAFWKKIEKYQPSLKAGGSSSRARDGWMKIKWAVLKKEDLARFKMDLVGHTESIEMLLAVLQFAAIRFDSKRNDQHHQTLAGKFQDLYLGCMQKISLVMERVSTGLQQGKQLLDITARIFQQNVQVFQIVLNLQNIITRIPGQVDRQQPVYFVDALGRHMPFHLEFILSAEGLRSVLRSNFKNVGSGAKKIDNGEFAIQDSATKMDIDLTSAWETCFTPGQHADMSMVFNSKKASNMCCPKCNDDNGDNIAQDKDIECPKCNVVYRRSVSVISQPSTPVFPTSTAVEGFITHSILGFSPDPGRRPKSPKRHRPHDEEEEMKLFRRVRIKTEIRVDDRGPEYSILVSNLGREVNEYVLVSLFQARFPSFKSAKLLTDTITDMPRGHGLVRFADGSDQQRALTEMQGVYCGNHPMRISTHQIDEFWNMEIYAREQQTRAYLAQKKARDKDLQTPEYSDPGIRRQLGTAVEADEDDPDTWGQTYNQKKNEEEPLLGMGIERERSQASTFSGFSSHRSRGSSSSSRASRTRFRQSANVVQATPPRSAEEELRLRLEAEAEADQFQVLFESEHPYNNPEILRQLPAFRKLMANSLDPYIDLDAEAALKEAKNSYSDSANERRLRLEAEAELAADIERETIVEQALNERMLEEERTFYDSEEDSDEPGNKYGPKARKKREAELRRMMEEEDDVMDISDDDGDTYTSDILKDERG